MRVMPVWIVTVSLLVFGRVSPLAAQNRNADSLAAYFRLEETSPLSCLMTYFPPLFIQYGLDLKAFIRSGTYRAIRRTCGDVRALDALFIRAMRLTNNNTAISLLLSTVAV